MKPKPFRHIKKVAVVIAMMVSSFVYANPQVGGVVSGNVSISQSGGNTVVTQTSQKAIVNWDSFNIAPGEHTHFQQPTGGIILNRINPNQGASEIYGRLTSTGTVVLVNAA